MKCFAIFLLLFISSCSLTNKDTVRRSPLSLEKVEEHDSDESDLEFKNPVLREPLLRFKE